jgi:SSS family solute:Na+ symporter
MHLSTLDWSIVGGFFLLSLVIGLYFSKRAGKSYDEYFLSGRNMPWWLLGISMVATTFSADTPNLVTDIVRRNGVAGNWEWWAFLLTGMLTVFVYARLWRRSGIATDLEFYELRYSGKAAAFLRGFRALYLGVFFNIMIMASVSLAAIKIGGILLGLSPEQTLIIASIVTIAYTALGGLTGVIWTDFFQFALAMAGTIWAAMVVVDLPEVNGLGNLLSHENVQGKLSLLPDFSDTNAIIPLFIIPIAVQWWSVWYPGAEPGGGGYIAQRMLSAKDEKNAVSATLLFNIAHYALRPWPWIIIALASLIVFPDLESLGSAFPGVGEDILRDDLAYPAMLTFLPTGLLGLVIASLIAAYMSTISSHLNWGSSYVVNDFYKRFLNQEATEKQMVMVGRISTVVLMIISALLALYLTSALDTFKILLQIGAGTGLIFILRWFWWRINAWSEITAMIVSFILALSFHFGDPNDAYFEDWQKLVLGVAITTIAWVLVTFWTRPTEKGTLRSFFLLIKPDKIGWKPVVEDLEKEAGMELQLKGTGKLPNQLLCMFFGVFLVYGALFATGYFLYEAVLQAVIACLVTLVSGLGLIRYWRKL